MHNAILQNTTEKKMPEFKIKTNKKKFSKGKQKCITETVNTTLYPPSIAPYPLNINISFHKGEIRIFYTYNGTNNDQGKRRVLQEIKNLFPKSHFQFWY
jgi:hypothetical protein